jgi:hypothetical protein
MGMRARLLADFIAEHGRPPSLRERAALIGTVHGPSKKQRRAARSSINARTPEGWKAVSQIVTCTRCHTKIAGRIRIGGNPQLVLPLPHKEWNHRCPGTNSLPVELQPRRSREVPKKISKPAPSPHKGAGAGNPVDRTQSRPPSLGTKALPLCAVPGPGFVLRKKTDPQAAVKVHRANLQDLAAEDMGGADGSDAGERDAQPDHQVLGTPQEWGRATAPHTRASCAGGRSDPQESEAPVQGTLSHGWGPRRERPP